MGATDLVGKAVPDYSSRGATKDGRHRPHVLAIGGDETDNVISCLVWGGYGPVGYGTSFAAPYVTGILALLLEADPRATPDQLRTKIVGLGIKIAALAIDVQGSGFVSVKSLP